MKCNRLLRIFSWIVFILAIPSISLARDYPQYHIEANINPDQKTISAVQSVTYTHTNDQPVENLYFHIYPNRQYTQKEIDFIVRYGAYFKVNPYPEGFQSSEFQLHSVSQNGEDLSFVIEGEDATILKVSLKRSLRKGQSTTIKMKYNLRIPHAYGRFGWHQNVMALSRWYPILSVHNRNGWNHYSFYPYHRPFFSEASVYNVELTVPQDFSVIHSGKRQSESALGDGTKKLTIDSTLPIREFTLAMSPDYSVIEEEFEGVMIKSFYLPGNEKMALEAIESAKDMMATYFDLMGPYPYPEFSIAPVHLGYGGEQMSNLIFIDTRVFELPPILTRYFDFLIAHETGHQWLYNMIGIDENTQIWLEEGLHSYLLIQHIMKKYGGDDAKILEVPEWAKPLEWIVPIPTFHQSRGFRYKMLARIGYDSQVIDELSSFQEPSTIFSIAYGKGSRIVEMLRHYMGEDAFARTLKRVYRDYRFRNLDVKDFIQLCEEESRQDLSWFFEPWLYTEEYFDVAVKSVKGNKVTLAQQGGIAMPVTVKVESKNGEEAVRTWDSKQTQTLTIDEVDEIHKVQLDPDQVLLDLDLTNNQWPRKKRFTPVPLYLPLYDINALLPDDAYNIVFGPELANGGLGLKASFQKPYDYTFYIASDYEFAEDIQHSRAGFQLNNILNTQTTFGIEVIDRNDLDDGDEDLVSGKVFLRRELWPVNYGFSGINDHVSLYLLRNKGLDGTLILGGAEDQRNLSFLKSDEAIVGANIHLNRSIPYLDPNQGFVVDALAESSGHFLGGTQYFYRTSVDTSFYKGVTKKSKVALRMKYGWGYPNDKMLFQLGGIDGLRGYDRKAVRGANVYLGSVEYRFPIKENLKWQFFDNMFAMDAITGVVFYDGGQAWFSDFGEATYRQDAGGGLRFHMSVGSFLEKAVLRADLAQAINADDEDNLQFWFGVNHAF